MPDLFLPEEPLPPYAFVPGRFPHPISDPAGHSYGATPETPPPPDPERWWECRSYLRGLDLFNCGYYWESHEAWEALWHACGRKGVPADFLKALIKLAAAGVKHLEEIPQGTKTHSCRAAELLREVARSLEDECDRYFGFHLAELLHLAEQVCREGWPATPILLVPVFPME